MSILRNQYYAVISERLSTLITNVEMNGKLNLLNLHNHAENFYAAFFKGLYNWELRNVNMERSNVESIDLVSHSQKIVVQVSSQSTKAKIESSLGKVAMRVYQGYNFKFIPIVKDAKNLKVKTYANPHNVLFNPQEDVYDVVRILRDVSLCDVDRQERIENLIVKELGLGSPLGKLDSNLSKVINVLSKEDLMDTKVDIVIDAFEIERKINFNNLKLAGNSILEYSIYGSRLNKIYYEFDLQGVNTSLSVLASIHKLYTKNSAIKTGDELFHDILENVKKKIIQSSNFQAISEEELDLCILVVVVDAFVRCKIFKHPNK